MNFHHEKNQRFLRTAFFLSIAVALSFCTRPEQDLGLDLQPEGDLLNVNQTDTLTLIAYTEVEDSLRSDELSQSLLGNTIDPETGPILASFYSELRLSAPDIDFGSNAVADSAVLCLRYAENLWGPRTPQQFQVFEVNEVLSQEEDYYTTQDFEVLPQDLVDPSNALQAIEPDTKWFIDGDSLDPQLRIPLQLDFAERLVTAGSEVYLTNTSWLDYFKGIYVRSISPNGSVISLDLIDPQSRLRLYYHNDTDTTFFDFNINSLCARSNRYRHSFEGPLAALNTGALADGNQVAFVQGGSRVKTRIEIPYIDILNQEERRVINKAELFLPLADFPDSRYPNQSLLFVLTETEDGSAVGLPGQLSTTIDIGGNYESASNRYRFNVTRWLQDYLNGNQAVNFLHLVSSNAGIVVNRVKLNGPEADPENPDRNMRLVITYSD